jgi:Alw26I/Eco31I/Esp3I family type II restriction m6 adenine DNA methyltransferase
LEFPEVFVDLENANWSENAGFDAVIGNPPYDVLAEKERKENLVDFMKYIQANEIFKKSLGGKLDLYRLFVCQALNLGSTKSYTGLIIPMSLLADQQVTNLRKHLLQSFRLFKINAFPQKDDSNRRIFKEAKLPTCIIFLKNHIPDQLINITIHPGNLIEEVSNQFSLVLSEIEMLDDISFSIPLTFSENKSSILKKFIPSSKMQKMKDICSNYQGEINETTMANLISLNPQDGYRILRGGNIQRYEFIDEPKQGVPKYLNLQAYNQKVGGEKSTHTLYSRIGYQRNAALDNWKRLIFAPLPTPSYCFDSISYFLIENTTNAFALLAILNSRLLEWRFRLTSTNNHVSTSEIDALPIRKINFTTESDRRQQGLENLVNLYQSYQTNFDLVPILSQCQQHLNQQPEEADIIHDFLAYLAEQMIALNQQKQTEIKGFLEWLESLIGCPIANLKNKSKIQNYLGDYSKQTTLDPALDLDGLITILNQNKKLIKIDPSSRQDHTRIKTEYQASLNILIPLKTQLKNCDRLIDEIVYQLYGLTPEEKAIIENSLSKQ